MFQVCRYVRYVGPVSLCENNSISLQRANSFVHHLRLQQNDSIILQPHLRAMTGCENLVLLEPRSVAFQWDKYDAQRMEAFTLRLWPGGLKMTSKLAASHKHKSCHSPIMTGVSDFGDLNKYLQQHRSNNARRGNILCRATAVGIVQHHRRSLLAAAHAPQPGVRIRGEAMYPNRQRQGLLQPACGLEISTAHRKIGS